MVTYRKGNIVLCRDASKACGYRTTRRWRVTASMGRGRYLRIIPLVSDPRSASRQSYVADKSQLQFIRYK